jgi:REP element-mobilizing transposase RayT
MTYYARNLPHWHPPAAHIFITWRLHGSLPSNFVQKHTAKTEKETGKQFRAFDRELDGAQTGPLWLKNPRIAKCVMQTIKRGETDLDLFDLHALVVMANHVHLLISPKIPVARITKGIKGASSRRANVILNRVGMRFWQEESFDHWVRSSAEFARIRAYIERNPVSAGLVTRPEEWSWSSATLNPDNLYP